MAAMLRSVVTAWRRRDTLHAVAPQVELPSRHDIAQGSCAVKLGRSPSAELQQHSIQRAWLYAAQQVISRRGHQACVGLYCTVVLDSWHCHAILPSSFNPHTAGITAAYVYRGVQIIVQASLELYCMCASVQQHVHVSSTWHAVLPSGAAVDSHGKGWPILEGELVFEFDMLPAMEQQHKHR
jgi:hypothetical protein